MLIFWPAVFYVFIDFDIGHHGPKLFGRFCVPCLEFFYFWPLKSYQQNLIGNMNIYEVTNKKLLMPPFLALADAHLPSVFL